MPVEGQASAHASHYQKMLPTYLPQVPHHHLGDKIRPRPLVSVWLFQLEATLGTQTAVWGTRLAGVHCQVTS